MVGVLEQLGYELGPPNAAQRLTQKVAASRPGAWTTQRVLYPLDKVVFRSTKGRATVASLTAGLPVIMLTTTGAKSGEQRTMPLVGTPYGDDIAIIGSNYGQERTPGWVYNLEADPVAAVAYRDVTVDVIARRLDDVEADRVFAAAAKTYAGYGHYRQRADHREIRVFALEAPEPASG